MPLSETLKNLKDPKHLNGSIYIFCFWCSRLCKIPSQLNTFGKLESLSCLVFQVFVNEVNTHREQVLALEKAGSQLRFASLKQDVVLIKNLLLSVQARWDKLVQRSLDRGRHLDEARKRAKQVLFGLLHSVCCSDHTSLRFWCWQSSLV